MQKAVSALGKLLRVSAYFGFVGLVFACLGARTVWGRAQSEALSLGSDLASLGSVAGASYTVLLNGESVHIASSTSDKPIGALLDHFQGECLQHTGGMEEEFRSLPERLKEEMPTLSTPLGMGVMRSQADGLGVVGCLERNGDEGYFGLFPRLEKFAESGDLHALGDLRYVVVRAADEANNVVVTVWSDGPLRIGAMLPEDGDAPGADPPNIQRMPGSRRMLTAGIQGSPFVINSYVVPAASPEEALGFYDEAMPKSGWGEVPLIQGALEREKVLGRAYSRQGVDTMIFGRASTDGQTMVSVVSMPPRAG
jgi:hypothetical protein